jgi:predicted nucleotidyltransferase
MISTRRSQRKPLISHERAQRIGEQFAAEQIILFGSYARGCPRGDSDVDVLVVMPAANEISQSIRLTVALETSFALDLIVRTPEHLRRGLEDGDSLLREIVTKGKVLYAQAHRAMGSQGRGRRQGRRRVGSA